MGQMVPFTMKSASQFLPENGPPDLGSRQWARESPMVWLGGREGWRRCDPDAGQ